MCIISCAGYLRFSELAYLRRSNVEFFPSHIKVQLEKSKTDIYREGRDVVIANTGNKTCPVELLQRYLKLANIPESSIECLFRSVSFISPLAVINSEIQVRFLIQCQEKFYCLLLKNLGLDKSKFGLHSLRSGGASAAANPGIEDRLFKKLGRWKSERAQHRYVKEDMYTKLSVSKNLGI